jgi:hypothetical protein
VNEILHQWTKQTNGSFNIQTRGVHTDDYFLYFSKHKNYETHIKRFIGTGEELYP